MADQNPPAYSEKGVRDSDVAPPLPPPPPSYTVQTVTAETYTAPTQFEIGSQTTPEPLVKISQVKCHLALLHAFAELKKQVEGLQEPIPQMPADLEKRWAWFVGLAVERFDIWCHALKEGDAEKNWEETLPPVDVMMVWHAYMLNPMWYTEDCMRIPACQILESVGFRFATSLNEGLRYALSTPPSQVRLHSWHNKTALPFDPVESAYKALTKTIRCPQCRVDIVVDMMTPTGTGYLQKKFSTSCPRYCGIPEITKETLALRKMAVDLASDSESFLAGTMLNPALKSATSINEEIKGKICKKAKKARDDSQIKREEDPCLYIMKYPEFSLSKLKAKILKSQLGSSRRLAARILSAYVDDKAYSVELPGAVLRQGSFVKKMYDLRWTGPGFFDSAIDELALHHAISRYHAFLDLMSSSPSSFFVPTLDIDLVWHTHQLMAADYQSACLKFMSRFIDHDDKVEGLTLSSGFDATCEAWKDRFNVQYSHCGCPISGDGIGTKLLKLVFSAELFVPPSHLLPFNRPDLLASTHPSDHNAVHFRSQNKEIDFVALSKYEELAKEKERDAKAFAEQFAIKAAKKADNANSGKVEKRPDYLPILDPPHLLETPSSGTNIKSSSTSSSYRYGYQTPFLVPVPIVFGTAWTGGANVASCVATDVSVIDPSGSCGIGGFNGSEGCGGTAGGVEGDPPPPSRGGGYYNYNSFGWGSSSTS